MRQRHIRFIAEIGIFSAVGLALDFFASLYSSFIWELGGSISLVLVPIVIMAFRWGLKGGLVTGFIIGTVQLLGNVKGVIEITQILLDYPLAFMSAGIAGIFAKKIATKEAEAKSFYMVLGIVLAGTLRFLFHFVSGVIFFAIYTPDGFDPVTWSIVYNGGYMVPTTVLTIIVVLIMQKQAPHLLTFESVETE